MWVGFLAHLGRFGASFLPRRDEDIAGVLWLHRRIPVSRFEFVRVRVGHILVHSERVRARAFVRLCVDCGVFLSVLMCYGLQADSRKDKFCGEGSCFLRYISGCARLK